MRNFFDYDTDLAQFNSLMEDIDDPTPMVVGEPTIQLESIFPLLEADDPEAEQEDKSADTSKVNGNEVVSLISDALKKKTQRSNLFKATYFANTYGDSFNLVKAKEGVSRYNVVNDGKATDYFKVDGDTITVNLSTLIRQNSSNEFVNKIKSITDWKTVSADMFGEFQKAIMDALQKLKDKVDSEDTAASDVNKSAGDEAQGEEAQGQGEEAQSEEPLKREDDLIEVPNDEDEPVDVPSDGDQKSVCGQILKDYQENYQKFLEADCDEAKESIDDEGRKDIADQYYRELMEPYGDEADDITKNRVYKVIYMDVKKFTTDPNEQKTENGNPDKDEMDWTPEPKKKTPDDESDNGKKKKDPNDPNKGYGNWLKNTLKNWSDEGVINTKLHPNPLVSRLKNAKQNSQAKKTKKQNHQQQQQQQQQQQTTQPKKPQKKKDEMQWG
jgi:hypothetical protein